MTVRFLNPKKLGAKSRSDEINGLLSHRFQVGTDCQFGLCCLLYAIGSQTGSNLHQNQPLWRDFDTGHFCDDGIHNAYACQGSVHFFKIFGWPSRVVCSIATITRFAPATRSIAPPMPLTILPGIIQFARLPRSSTSMAPSTLRSMCPPRIMPNESALEK